MGAYSYKALDEAGKTIKGILEADSERHVRSQLRAKKLKPIEVVSSSGVAAQETKAKSGFSFSRAPKLRLTTRELSMVTRQLASLINSGLPLDEALMSTAKQAKSPNVKRVVLQVRSRVLEGLSLAQAMGDAPQAFDGMYRALVRAGEGSGYLSPVLERLAQYTQTSQILQQRLKMAMIYPIAMVVVCIAVVVGMVLFIIPKLKSLFDQGGRELPFITQMLIDFSAFLQNYGLILLVAIVATIFLVRRLLKKPTVRKRWHALQLRLPVFGELIVQINTARFAATLSLLTASGVPLLQALNISSQVMSNETLQASCEGVVAQVREGMSLSRAMDSTGVFPPLLTQLVASGETNGTLAQQLDNAAKDQERDLEMMLGVAMGLLEPATIIIMGAVIGTIVVAILMPIFEMAGFAR